MKILGNEIQWLLEDTQKINNDIMRNRENSIVDMLIYEKLHNVKTLKEMSKEQLMYMILNYQSTLESIWEEVENAQERLEEN